ncbi:MAG: hypothetical protein ACLTSL_12250 [Odoribacter splanchnicus]
MNISAAEFDWISLILVIGAGFIGWIKSNNAKKTQVPPVFEQPDPIGEEEEILPNVEEYTITENKDISDEPVIQEVVADYYRDPKVTADVRNELPTEENEEEEHVQFDIRQAIISSEILKRPQY